MKRDYRELAIQILIVLDCLLLAAFLVLKITDTRIVQQPEASEAPVIVEEAQRPDTTEAPSEADAPEQIFDGEVTADRPLETAVPVGEAQVDANLITGSFAARGGPDFSLYVDQASLQLIETEGRVYVAPPEDLGATLYLELCYYPAADAGALAPSLLEEYGAIEIGDGADTELAGHKAISVTGKSTETRLEAYVIAVDGGCVTVVLCTPGDFSSNDAPRLRAALESLMIS